MVLGEAGVHESPGRSWVCGSLPRAQGRAIGGFEGLRGDAAEPLLCQGLP